MTEVKGMALKAFNALLIFLNFSLAIIVNILWSKFNFWLKYYGFSFSYFWYCGIVLFLFVRDRMLWK